MLLLLNVSLFILIPVASDFLKREAGSVGARERELCFILYTHTLHHLQAGKRSASAYTRNTHIHETSVSESCLAISKKKILRRLVQL